jgi:hypothetical protein
MMRQVFHFMLASSVLGLFFAGYVAIELRRYSVAATPAAAIYLSLMMLFVLYLAPGFSPSRQWCMRHSRGLGNIWICVAAFLVPYLVYGIGTATSFTGPCCGVLPSLRSLSPGCFRPRRRHLERSVQHGLHDPRIPVAVGPGPF